MGTTATVPAVGSVWRKGDEWRRVSSVRQNSLWYETFNEYPGESATFREWEDWIVGGDEMAVQVWPPGETPKPQGETVRVRAAVAYGNGQAAVAGYHIGGDGDDGLVDDALQRNGGGAIIAFIEADIPLPPVPVVTASVETTQC